MLEGGGRREREEEEEEEEGGGYESGGCTPISLWGGGIFAWVNQFVNHS